MSMSQGGSHISAISTSAGPGSAPQDGTWNGGGMLFDEHIAVSVLTMNQRWSMWCLDGRLRNIFR